MKNKSVNALVVCGMSLALATITSLIKLFSLPMGGSVTLCSMMFITLIGYIYGPVYSFSAAITYGLLQFVIKPDFYTPLQVIIDYVLAFGSLGLSGLLYQKSRDLYLGYLLGITGRFIFATLSGYIFWASYAPEGWNPLWYSICYNGSYIYAEGIITIILMMIPAVKKQLLALKINQASIQSKKR